MGEVTLQFDHAEAKALCEWSLALHRSLGDQWGTAAVLVLLSSLVEHFGDYGQARELLELYALVTRHPYFGNSRYCEDITGKHIAAAAAALPPEVVAAAEERGRARDLDATVAELLGEFEG